MKKKFGGTIIALPIIFVICTLMLLIIFKQILNYILPFIYYQKIENIATKYIFVIEKFGYLTNDEYNNLMLNLEDAGLEKEKIYIEYPSEKKPYGNLISLKIEYKYEFPPALLINSKNKETIISVDKNSFSKIY